MFRAIVVLILLAGCTSTDPPEDPIQEPAAEADAPAPVVNVTQAIHPVDWQGNLGTQVTTCGLLFGDCTRVEILPDETDLYFERPGANLTAIDLAMTWQSGGPATDVLALEIMIMAKTDDCESRMLDGVEGRSPLELSVSDLDEPLRSCEEVHAYVYNPNTWVSVNAAFVGTNIDQSFTVDGTLTTTSTQA